jgi:YVTN family beta-propeller protein
MEFRILGSLEVEDDGRLLKLGGAKQRAVLALLLLHANEVVPRERMIDEVWGASRPETATTALQVQISQLRKLLGSDRIVTRAPGYALRLDSGELDLERFQSLTAMARRQEPMDAAETLRLALILWRGTPLAELEDQPFVQRERLRLEELHLGALAERIEADLALGRHAELVSELEGLVVEHPLRERLRGQLMVALYRTGRQAEALEVYRSGRRQLDDELGLEPGDELKRLERAILEQDPSLAATAVDTQTGPTRAGMPTGTVTFLFTDIEGSTQLVKELGGRYSQVHAEHQRILRAAFAAHGGHEVDTQGDSFFVAFRRAKDAVAAAVAAQRDVSAHAWPEGANVKVRMGLHTGEPHVGEERYVGLGVHKAARIGAAGHGGQVLLSRTTRELVEDDLPPGVVLRDLGERRLKDVERPEQLSQLVIEGLPSEFGALNTLDVQLRRKRRRMYAGAALIGVLAAAVAIPVFALGQGSGGGANVEPNSVAIIDTESNRVVGSVHVGIRPSSVAVGAGAVWVGNLDDRTISRIDPALRAVQQNIGLEYTPSGLATGAGAVWIANGILGTVSRLDPTVNSVVETIEVTGRSSAGSIAFRDGQVWAAFGIGEVGRINPTSNDLVEPKAIAGVTPSAIAIGEGSVWVANSGENTVSRINPRTASEVSDPSTGRRPLGVAVGAGSVWVTNGADDSVTRIDAASGSTATISVGKGPIGVAFGAGAIWVANGGDGTVSRIDAETGDVVKTIRVGGAPTGVAVGDGVVWVTVQAPEEDVT